MRRGIYLLTPSLEVSTHWLPPSTDVHSSHHTALYTPLSLPSFSTAPPLTLPDLKIATGLLMVLYTQPTPLNILPL